RKPFATLLRRQVGSNADCRRFPMISRDRLRHAATHTPVLPRIQDSQIHDSKTYNVNQYFTGKTYLRE
ncbi:hypothetical protein, partial [Mesorhizobium sp. M1C.F.Ca.ET.195.01.1.1]|uniref:hypothetical protein n=1 Tax=Mesorhizobium sp. M1C.F.Ca.ET.195.01.1.1 TaxID=2563927 RepID=UPI001AEEA583